MSVVSLRRRSGWIAIVLLVILAAFYFFGSPLNSSSLGPVPSSAAAQPVGDVPNMPDKPQPPGVTFDGCPPEGDGGDSQLNVIKNRVDRGDYLPVSFDSLLALTWPKTVERQYMKDWSPSALAFIQQYQGIPVSLEGYISSIREAGPEPANCNRDSHANLDLHIYFTKNPKYER